MTNEAVLKVETHTPINFNISGDTAVEKGAICKLSNPMVATLSDGANDVVAGITQSEKVSADEGLESIAVYRGGIFRVTCSGSISAGHSVVTQGNPNVVRVAATNEENILGVMLEDAAEGETKLMELRPTRMELA